MDIRHYLASVLSHAESTLAALCKPVERDGSDSDANLVRVHRGDSETWYRIKRKSGPKIDHAVHAARTIEAVHAAEQAYDATVEACGEETAGKLFDAACELGRFDALHRQEGMGCLGLAEAQKLEKAAMKTRRTLAAKRPDYKRELQTRLDKGMQLTKARQEIADLHDVDLQTVEGHTKGMKTMKR